MVDEVKHLVDDLREDAEWAHANEWETPITLGDNLDAAADMIEKLSALLENPNRIFGQYSRPAAMGVDMLEAEIAAWQRRAEAAERDITKCCGTCLYYHEEYNGFAYDHDCKNPNGCCNVSGMNTGWQWRGPCAENGGTL